MIDVALCIATEHDPWLVALAVLICGAGAFAIVQMFERACNAPGLQRFGWVFLTSGAAGATIWCTHFVAMLAFEAKAPVQLDPVLTIGSLIVAVCGSFFGFLVAGWRADRGLPAIGGGAVRRAPSRPCISWAWPPIACRASSPGTSAMSWRRSSARSFSRRRR